MGFMYKGMQSMREEERKNFLRVADIQNIEGYQHRIQDTLSAVNKT